MAGELGGGRERVARVWTVVGRGGGGRGREEGGESVGIVLEEEGGGRRGFLRWEPELLSPAVLGHVVRLMVIVVEKLFLSSATAAVSLRRRRHLLVSSFWVLFSYSSLL